MNNLSYLYYIPKVVSSLVPCFLVLNIVQSLMFLHFTTLVFLIRAKQPLVRVICHLQTSLILTEIAQKPPWPALGSVPDLPENSGSDETFEFASRCLKECASNARHQLCQPQRRMFRPTRLLQISEPGKSIKLQEKWYFSSYVDYVALSHCWVGYSCRFILS